MQAKQTSSANMPPTSNELHSAKLVPQIAEASANVHHGVEASSQSHPNHPSIPSIDDEQPAKPDSQTSAAIMPTNPHHPHHEAQPALNLDKISNKKHQADQLPSSPADSGYASDPTTDATPSITPPPKQHLGNATPPTPAPPQPQPPRPIRTSKPPSSPLRDYTTLLHPLLQHICHQALHPSPSYPAPSNPLPLPRITFLCRADPILATKNLVLIKCASPESRVSIQCALARHLPGLWKRSWDVRAVLVRDVW